MSDRESYETFSAFMCKTSFEHDIEAGDGTRIYLTEKAARGHARCIDQCGLVEVQVTLTRVVQQANYDLAAQAGTSGANDPPREAF